MSFISRYFGPSQLLTQEEFDTVVSRDYRRNATIFILFDVFWGIGMTFAMFQTVVPAYMVAIGCSKTLIGLITSFWPYITPAQILISHFFRTRMRKGWLMGSYTMSVALWLLYSLVFLFFPDSVGHNLKTVLFSFCMILFMIFCAGNSTLQFSLITDCTPLTKRGSLYGYRFVAQALAVLAISPVASWLMGRWEEPTNFLAAFIVGCTFYIICFSIVLIVREHRNPQHLLEIQSQASAERLLPTTTAVLSKMVRNRQFLVFMVFAFLFAAAFMLGNFVIVFAKDQLGITGSQVVSFTVIQMLSAAIFCVLLGKLADKVGYKAIYVLQSLLLCGGFLIPLYVAMNPGKLAYGTTYYWRVVSNGPNGSIEGPVWSFTTVSGSEKPNEASKDSTDTQTAVPSNNIPSVPFPADGATGVATDVVLTWSGVDGETGYDIYLSTVESDVSAKAASTQVADDAAGANRYDLGLSIIIIYLGFILYTSGLGVQGMVLMNMLVELFPDENCATVIALYNLITMPLNMVIGPLAGWSVDKTGSYIPVFAVSAGMCLVSAIGFLLFVREPRKAAKELVKELKTNPNATSPAA